MCVLDPITELHFWGWQCIFYLQKYLSYFTEWMLFLSKLGDPRYAFLIYFPLVFCLNRSAGTRVLWVACVTEWLNAVFKLILHGERPYWWIGETFYYLEKEELDKMQPKQFYLTCETGPGSPSGHAMVTSAVFYVMATEFLGQGVQKPSTSVKSAVWAGYSVIILAVSVSRVYIATHFPHQVIAGAFVGAAIANQLKVDHVALLHTKHYVLCAAASIGLTIFTYYTLLYLEIDPLWSIPKAQKWCANPDWVYLDTSLFFAITRDISCLAGFGMCVNVVNKLSAGGENSASTVCIVVKVIVSLFVTLTIESIRLPRDSDTIFYAAATVRYFAVMCNVVFFIPYISGKLSSFWKKSENVKIIKKS